MRSATSMILTAFIAWLACVSYTRAERVSAQEAMTIAQNYVDFIIASEGDWGGSKDAKPTSIEELTRDGRTLGYFCQVRPQGYLILSLHKELAPVKAYSIRSNLTPDAEEGLADLIKFKMSRTLDAVELQLGRSLKHDDTLDNLLEINYRSVSSALASKSFRPEVFQESRGVNSSAGMDYQEGETLLPCNWHQQPPYNQQCPYDACGWSRYNGFNGNTRVGCVAVVGAQVMRHWNWPPEGVGPFADRYDWPNMLAEYHYDADAHWFNDENGVPVTWDQINAVAELCDEVGEAVDMNYGCDESATPTAYLEDAFEDYFRYDIDGAIVYRSDYDSGVDWFNELKRQINANRPVPYRVEGHAIVADGWQEVWDQGNYRWFHMNYGWPSDSDDVWWALDAMPLHSADDYAIANVVPDTAIGPVLGGAYPSGVRRYFNRDVVGSNAYFAIGQDLQILKSGFLMVNSGGPTDAIEFHGEPGATIRFFLEGDIPGKTRIRVQGGAMKIKGGGGLVIR